MCSGDAGNIELESMASIKEEIVSSWPPLAEQSHNKFFANRLSSRTQQATQNESSDSTSPATIVQLNKYFVSNVSSIRHVDGTAPYEIPSTASSMKAHAKQRNGTHSAVLHKSPNATVSSASVLVKPNRTALTHFQIGQTQLIQSKNIRTESPPKMNDILESLSVSSSKHLHHDHRYVIYTIVQQLYTKDE